MSITVPDKYELLLEELKYANKKIRSTFIDSPSNLEYCEKRDRIQKKIDEFRRDYPECFI